MDSVNIVHLPDLHFGHPKVNAVEVHSHLARHVYPELKKCDLLVIGGDFFHELIGLNSGAGYHAISVIDELIDMAFQYHFYIRIVRGTVSHDRMQNKAFIRTNRTKSVVDQSGKIRYIEDDQWVPYSTEQLNGKPLIAFYNTVAVETDLLGMNLLFVPDDMPYDNVMDHIRDAMKKVHVDKIDIVISHGYFKHLLPIGIPKIPKNCLDWEEMKGFVQGCVLNGHVHKPSVYEKVVSGGSFERMQHGEEEDKGFFTVKYDLKTHKVHFKFHVNPDALFFKTIKLEEDTQDANIEKYKIQLKELMDKASRLTPVHIRIVTEDTILKQSLIDYTKNMYPDFRIYLTSMKPKELATYSTQEQVILNTSDLPVVTEENLPELLVKFAQDNLGDFGINTDEVKRILNVTKEIRRI